jgi:hypothetical protein
VTITVPAGPSNKSSGLDEKTKIKLVTEVLLSAKGRAGIPAFEIERTKENQLSQLGRDEILSALESILTKSRDLFVIVPATFLMKEAAKTSTFIHEVDPVVDGRPARYWHKWKEVPEETPIILGLQDGFNNWCEAQIHKRNTILKSLSEESRIKVLETVAAIHQQFELTSNPKVSIGWVAANLSKNLEARRLTLEFLENQDVVKHHKFSYTGTGFVEVEIDVKEFFQIQDELLALYAPTTDGEEALSQNATLAVVSNPFGSIEGLRWQDINIRFVDGHGVKIAAKDIALTVDFKQLGFEDARTRNPNSQWDLLKLLAKGGGQLSWEDSEASDNFKKKKQLLSNTLKAYFQIDEDPFFPYRSEKAYRTKFKLKAEGD